MHRILQAWTDDYGLGVIQSLFEVIEDIFRNVKKVLLHAITGRCELERICGGNKMHNAAMSNDFARSVKRSKVLKSVGVAIFGPQLQPFDVTNCCDQIVSVKHLPAETSLLVANIRNCLIHMNLLNKMVEKVLILKNETFSDSEPKHVALLEELWTNMRPQIKRKGGRITAEWEEVGFQGKDPATDFRGMGMLGLVQLVYLSKHSNKLAVQLLQESQIDDSYFPFAATGINVTAFALELLLETRFHDLIYREMDRILLNDTFSVTDPSHFDDKTIEDAAAVFHRVYCMLFLRLGRMWLTSDSVDLMGFPKVFQQFKSDARGLYPKL